MSQENNSPEMSRRPIATRNATLAHSFARWLAQKSISPNQISIASIFFALGAGSCLAARSFYAYDILLLFLAAVFIQCRLLCNLFDGMVAVEGGKSTKSGEIFNDMPDRIADPLIFVGAGLSISFAGYGHILGWAAGLLAVITAYVRILAVSTGAPQLFMGPMAKQHRMAVITAACILSIFESYIGWDGQVMTGALVIIVAGCIITIIRRARRAYVLIEQEDGTDK